MPQENQDSLAGLYQLADALNLSLSAGEKQILEAWMRSQPQTGVIDQVLTQTQHLIDNEKQRTSELMAQAKANEGALQQSAQQREAVIRQWLAAKQQAAAAEAGVKPAQALTPEQTELIQQAVNAAVQARMQGLVEQVEAVISRLGQPAGAPAEH
ncbi:hypothetical protein [Pseudomonas chlororaphis]|uniref:hypothetical protein n=1 Tax=Pseudomonas chlororaphis TaxID=587753 RepID=UPI0003D2E9DE|nr:hypothetical protein [Pseudomonas chlororaphis]AZD26984.1 hypothetical protein C4K23_0203 [Pseudomonas chlororaphis]ETD35106.1 hypothetical protein U724_26610 [Pseudomonas chlororaphis subsp. aurantiaca PB-St2]QFS58234.1 hypothetical protein FD951_28020 [Pseudomonas chlororaphis subsp. aurantiaca]